MKYLREKYELGKKLGTGFYGVVYSATRKVDGLPVAIKFLFSDAIDETPAEILFTEMCAGVKGVIKLYEWHRGHYRLGGGKIAHYAMVLERFGTKDLYDHINDKRSLGLKESFTIFVQLVRVWKDLYNLGVCHNDLKDENVLISDTGEVRLIDFSCATAVGAKNYFEGTRVYRPPEFITRQEFDVQSADSWAFGILLFDMLQGDIPFETDLEIVSGNFKCTKGSPESTALITKCLDPVAEKRPSIEDLLKESESILDNL